jgi:hypothetical protein
VSRCPTCRHEVQHLHKLAWLICRFGRAAQAHPRLRVVLDRHKAAHEKAEARHAEHILRAHTATCLDCRRYLTEALTKGPDASDDERSAAAGVFADHVIEHIKGRAA